MAKLKSILPISIVILLQFLLLWRLGAIALAPSGVERWVSVLTSRDPVVRLTAVEALGEQGGAASRALPKLLEISNSDSDPQVREAATRSRNNIRGLFGSSIGWITWVFAAVVTIAAAHFGWKWIKSEG